MAGRRPIPTELKILRGNPGKRRLNRQEPRPPVSLPPCPRHLRGVARRAWKEIGAELASLRVMTNSDAQALELLCLALQEYRQAVAVIVRKGATYRSDTAHGSIERKRPEVDIASDAWRRVKSMLQEFGLTPAARTRVQVRPPEALTKAGKFLFGSRGRA